MVPNIRVKGFNGDWEVRSLGEIYTERNERGDDSLQILSVSIHDGVSDGELDEEGLGKVVRRSEDKTTYKHVYEGDLVFNMMRAWQGAIGVVKSEGMISPAYISAIPNEDVYPPFMDYVLRRKEAIDQINNLSYGVTDFRKRLYWDSFVKVKCCLPSVQEQRKIADALESLDRYILLNQRQCDDLRELKKYMLQKMFPKDDEKIPEIRFEGFTDAWEQRKLGDIGTTFTGLSGKTKDDFGHGDARFVTYMNVFTNPVSDPNKVEAVEIDKSQNSIQYGDVFFTTSSETPEEVGMSSVWLENTDDTYLNSFCFGYRPTEKIDPYYMAYMLRSETVRKKIIYLAQGISRYNISKNGVMQIEVPLPDINEQRLVGEYFSNLDNLITLHQRRHDTLLEFKAYLLQNMFPKEG